MSVIDTLIFNRTLRDIEWLKEIKLKILTNGLGSLTVEERAGYLSGAKGAYNYTDLNRVGEAVKYLRDNLANAPLELQAYLVTKGVASDRIFNFPQIKSKIFDTRHKMDWTVRDIPLESEIETYLNDIEIMRNALELPIGVPNPPHSLNRMTIEEANNIERILHEVNVKLESEKKRIYSLIDRCVLAYEYSDMIYLGQ